MAGRRNDLQGHLIDFQISVAISVRPHALGRFNAWLFERIRHEDLYHVAKHKRKLAPEEMTSNDWALCQEKSWISRWHKVLIRRPWLFFKRKIYPKGSDELRQTLRPGAGPG